MASNATEMSASCSVQRRPAPPFALRRAEQAPRCVSGFFPGHALYAKGLQINRRRYTVQQPATKSARGPGDKPVINRGSTDRFVRSTIYIVFPLFVFARRRSRQFFTVRWKARRAVGFQGHRNVGTLFCPASPRPAVRRVPCRPDPPVVCPGFGIGRWTRQVESSVVRKTPISVVPHRSAGLRLHQLPHRMPSLCTHRLPLHASPARITSSSFYPRLDPWLHATGTEYVYL